MSGVEKLAPGVVDKVKPDEKEDVDAHPDHLQTQPRSRLHQKPQTTHVKHKQFAYEMQDFGVSHSWIFGYSPFFTCAYF